MSTGVETISDSSIFCQCGNLLNSTRLYYHCKNCEHFRYKIGRYSLTNEPPIFTEVSLALAAIRVETPDYWLEEWEKFSTLENAFVKAEGCLPNHLFRLPSKYLLLEYLDTTTELMIHDPVSDNIAWTTGMKNARTAVMSVVKRCMYGTSRARVEFDPLKDGELKRYFLEINNRVRSGIESMSEYMDSIHCCLDCGAIGDKMILLAGSRISLDGCSDCN